MKVLRWLSKTVLTMAFVCLLTVMTTLYVMKSYTEQVLGQIGIQFENGQLILPQWLTPIAGQGNSITINEGSSEGSSDGSSEPDDAQEPIETFPKDQAIEVWKQESEHVIVPVEAFEEMKDQLSSDAKAEIFSMIIGNVPFEEMQHLSEMMEDGITLDELQVIEQMMSTHLSEADYDKLMTLINF